MLYSLRYILDFLFVYNIKQAGILGYTLLKELGICQFMYKCKFNKNKMEKKIKESQLSFT